MTTSRADLGFAERNRGSYSANLIGTIRSHLEGLQGYDVMALELIQNADDAGSNGQGNRATEIVFDVTDAGLNVRNDGAFTYCGELRVDPCPQEKAEGYGCDYHRITKVASGGKLSRSDNIGRFGIGFVSTYQIADHPQIHSAGIKLTLIPEREEWLLEDTAEATGTTFFLPWAIDPASDARVGLGASAVTTEHIEKLVEDFNSVLRRALLFLRHLKRAELRRNGTPILSCELERNRDDETELLVTFKPGNDVERWLIIRADAANAAQEVYDRFPRLEMLDRKTQVSVAIRVGPKPLPDGEGLVYAYLPTEQATSLPIHVNADFFPESDRKAVIFSGSQHQQAWNELLIATAADALASDLEGLRVKLGAPQLWAMISHALAIKQDRTGHFPRAFHAFWDAFKASVDRGAAIALAFNGDFKPPSQVLYPKQPLELTRLEVLSVLGGDAIAEVLRPHRNALLALGTAELTFDRLVRLMETSLEVFRYQVGFGSPERFESFYLPLWGLTEALFPEAITSQSQQIIGRLKVIPFIVDPKLYPCTIKDSHRAIYPVCSEQLAEFFPSLRFASDKFAEFPHLNSLVTPFDLQHAVTELRRRLVDDNEPVAAVIPNDDVRLKQLYSILAALDELSRADESVYSKLRPLPIWMTGKGFVSATHALLPGDFTDPTGQAELINQKLLDKKALAFVQDKLGVKRQTIEAFVKTVVPRFFGAGGPKDLQIYKTLITTLANHPGLLDKDDLRAQLANLPLVPTLDGGWAVARETYFQTKELTALLGQANRLWVHVARLTDSRAVRAFLETLGVRRTPSPLHLAKRIIQIAEAGPPADDPKKESEKAFYALCEMFADPELEDDMAEALSLLTDATCLPSDGEAKQWFAPAELYAPFRYQAFESQVNVLDFKNPQRLNGDFLAELGIFTSPETKHVVNHLLHCVENHQPPHYFVWQLLNERAKTDASEFLRLRGQPCIYDQSLKEFLRPNQVYLTPQQLGRYAFALPAALDDYKALFKCIGVKESPEPQDYVDILLDIVTANYARQIPLGAADHKVYEVCMSALGQAWNEGLLTASELHRLQIAPTMLNVPGRLCHPDEVLLHDSEWHRQYFGGDLDESLCKPAAAEIGQFIKALGTRKLSEVAFVTLDFVDGIAENEDVVCELFVEKADILARMLLDKPRKTREDLGRAIQHLTARSHDVVRIRASVHLGGEPLFAAPKDVKAFYDAAQGELVLARPFNVLSWVHIFSAVLHQLMPEESGSNISTRALALSPLMNLTHAEAEEHLAVARVPLLEVEQTEEIDITSITLEGFGAESVSCESGPSPGEDQAVDLSNVAGSQGTGESEFAAVKVPSAQVGEPQIAVGQGNDLEGIQAGHPISPGAAGGGSGPPPAPIGSVHRSPGGSTPGRTTPGTSAGSRGKGNNRGRAGYKSLWDRKLISYVRKSQTETEPDDEDSDHRDDHAYKLAIEAAARAAVCKYERKRGREPAEMAQTHPGYDIESGNPTTDKIERYIEVKGTSGEWNNRGVGLSKLQFSTAQNLGDQFWLYVVEFALDENAARVHAIQSPALKIDHFMFDGQWRLVATDEAADPTLGFRPGARIDCGRLGEGWIAEVQQRGQIRNLIIDFDDGRKSYLPLNLRTMRIIEDADGEDDS